MLQIMIIDVDGDLHSMLPGDALSVVEAYGVDGVSAWRLVLSERTEDWDRILAEESGAHEEERKIRSLCNYALDRLKAIALLERKDGLAIIDLRDFGD